MNSDINLVLNYYLVVTMFNPVPPEILLSLCRAYRPDRTWRLKSPFECSRGWYGPPGHATCVLRAAVTESGKSAHDLMPCDFPWAKDKYGRTRDLNHWYEFTWENEYCDGFCLSCGKKDQGVNGWGELAEPCPKPVERTMNKDIQIVTDYFLQDAIDYYHPSEVLLALCRLKCPERQWRLNRTLTKEVAYRGCYLNDIVDEEDQPATNFVVREL